MSGVVTLQQVPEQINVRGKPYRLLSRYQEEETLRFAFHALTRRIWGFDFEAWYRSGHWGNDTCILYTLFDGDKAVSHVTVNVLDFIVRGTRKTFVQIGTVMTDKQYRQQGLSKQLMDVVAAEWKPKCDMMYLYANSSVRSYYGQFGFVPVMEYEAMKRIAYRGDERRHPVRLMDLNDPDDLEQLASHVNASHALFQLSAVGQLGVVLFYLKYLDASPWNGHLYTILALHVVVFAQYDGNRLVLYDIWAKRPIALDDVIDALVTAGTDEVILRVTPHETDGYTMRPYREEDLTLFVMEEHRALFEQNRLMFPLLSHT